MSYVPAGVGGWAVLVGCFTFGAVAGGLAGSLIVGGCGLLLGGGFALLARRSFAAVRGTARGVVATLVGVGLVFAGGAVSSSARDDEATPVTPTARPSSAAPSSPAATPTGTPTPTPTPAASPSTGPSTGPQEAGTALAVLATLPVKGRAPMTGYDRGQFEYGEVDLDGNGCDTRNDILARDLSAVKYRPGGCLVSTGTLADPYSGRAIAFTRGTATSSAVQIDHVVALADAWQKGAQRWDAATKARFGNDPLNLLAVDGPLNQQKGAGDAATWLPPNKAFRCAYVARQIAVKHQYGLWVTQAERDAMARVLAACPDEPVPASSAPATTASAPPVVLVPDEPADPADPADLADVYFKNCSEARSAGAAPLYVGTPGYRPALDRDKDGVACE